MTLDPLDFVGSVEQGSRTSSDTGVLRLTVADIGTVKTTRITATDSSGNTAQCSVQVKVEGRSFFLMLNLTGLLDFCVHIFYICSQIYGYYIFDEH